MKDIKKEAESEQHCYRVANQMSYIALPPPGMKVNYCHSETSALCFSLCVCLKK